MANRNVTITCAHGIPYIDGVAVSAGVNSVADGSHTFSVDEAIIQSSIRYRNHGWSSGSGDIASTGTGQSTTVVISQTSAITWDWYTETSLQCPGCGCFSFNPSEGDKGSMMICMVCGYNLKDNPALSES